MDRIEIQVQNIAFIVDANISYEGDPNDIAEFNDFLVFKNLHIAMAQEFEDESNLEEFKALLVADPNTAFTVYHQNHGRLLP